MLSVEPLDQYKIAAISPCILEHENVANVDPITIAASTELLRPNPLPLPER